MMDKTTIAIRKETMERLANLGKKRETYDDIIVRLIEFYERHKGASNEK